MHFDDVRAAGTRVQPVDVLRDHRLHQPPPLELGDRVVRRVRLRVAQDVDPFAVEAPHPLGVATERVDRGDLERIDLGPDPRVRAEVRDAGLGRHPGAREHDARLTLTEELR